MSQTHLQLTVELAAIFDELGIRYVLGGSVASSLVGEPRSTIDVDIAVELTESALASLVHRVRPSFYVPEADAARAVREHDSFNIIHHRAALKVDLFVLNSGPLDVSQINRRVLVEVPTDPPVRLWVTSVEDQVLRKLDWYRQGGHSSDRQWRDVVAILRINRRTIDNAYLRTTAEQVDLTASLETAQAQAASLE